MAKPENKIILQNIERLMEKQERELFLLKLEVVGLKNYIHQKDSEPVNVIIPKTQTEVSTEKGWFW
tara:strand:- start:489 stop:686 length:198 start_codon:yes stop_codon:yes gene_type:complete